MSPASISVQVRGLLARENRRNPTPHVCPYMLYSAVQRAVAGHLVHLCPSLIANSFLCISKHSTPQRQLTYIQNVHIKFALTAEITLLLPTRSAKSYEYLRCWRFPWHLTGLALIVCFWRQHLQTLQQAFGHRQVSSCCKSWQCDLQQS